MSRMKRAVSVLGLTAVLGYGVGWAVAAAEDDPTGPRTPTVGKYDEELKPYKTLGNGKTAGGYRLDTPLDERPDYVTVRASNGKRGYMKIEDWDPYPLVVDPDEVGKARQLSPEEQKVIEASRQDAMDQARGTEEPRVPIYGEDGETVIGYEGDH